LLCIGLGGFGFLLEFGQLYRDLKEVCSICGCCRSRDLEPGNTDGTTLDDTTCKCRKEFCKSCPGAVREIVSILFNEVLLYATVVCTIMGFINERTWELRNFWNYVDCLSLTYSTVMEVFLPRWF